MDRGHFPRLNRGDGVAGAWSVRSYLLACVGCALVVFAVIEVVIANTTLRDATTQSRRGASFQAGLASAAVAQSLQQGESALAGLSRGLDISAVVANPAACSLSFSGLGVFGQGHIDVVLPDGRVPCSSLSTRGAPAGATQAGAAWLSNASSAPAVSALFTDRLTGKRAIAVSVAITDAAKKPTGLISVVLPLDGLAAGLTQIYGGPEHFVFAVTDTSGQQVLSALSPTSNRSRKAAMPVVGSRRDWVEAAAPVAGVGWQVVAGQRTADALAATRTLLWKETGLAVVALLVLLGLLAVVNRKIGRPLRRLTRAIARAARDASPAPVDAEGPAELRRLADQFNHTLAARVLFEEQLSHDALHDQLTGLPNQALLLDRLAVTLDGRRGDPGTVGVLAIGIDRFALVNTNLGYRVGDIALATIAERLAGALRPGQTVARLGGGEFAIALDTPDRGAALVEAVSVLASIAKPIDADGHALALTASVGVALAELDVSAEELLRNATTAMHTAKEHGGARHRLFDPSQRTLGSARLSLESDLHMALDRGELHVEYQPVVVLPSGRVTGAEALLRWTHPVRGPIPPATFIPLAEDTGLIQPIGRFVLEQACAQAAAWNQAGFTMRIAVNVSGRQLLEGAFDDEVTRVLESTGMDPSLLCLELTESTLMDDVVRVAEALRAVKRSGLSISVDDFGTGYSSLSYLQRFPVDELKIDRSFVNGLGQDDDRNLVAAVIGIAHALSLRVVAEGVETQAQAAELITLGCRSAQGYFYGRPQNAQAFSVLLRRQNLDLVGVRTA